MSGENEQPSNERNSLSAWQIGFLFTGLAFFAPAFIVISWSIGHSVNYQILGMFWWASYVDIIGVWQFESGFYTFVILMMFTLLRPVFAVQMVRYYKGKSSKRLTLLIGLITELQPMIVYFQTIIMLTESNLGFRLPIPILLSLAIVMMRIVPPQQKPELRSERKEEKKQSWWSGDSTLQLSQIDLLYKILETVLVFETILCIYGAFTIAYWFPAPLVILYWIIIPWSTLITGILFLVVRYMKRNYLREEVPS